MEAWVGCNQEYIFGHVSMLLGLRIAGILWRDINLCSFFGGGENLPPPLDIGVFPVHPGDRPSSPGPTGHLPRTTRDCPTKDWGARARVRSRQTGSIAMPLLEVRGNTDPALTILTTLERYRDPGGSARTGSRYGRWSTQKPSSRPSSRSPPSCSASARRCSHPSPLASGGMERLRGDTHLLCRLFLSVGMKPAVFMPCHTDTTPLSFLHCRRLPGSGRAAGDGRPPGSGRRLPPPAPPLLLPITNLMWFVRGRCAPPPLSPPRAPCIPIAEGPLVPPSGNTCSRTADRGFWPK